MLCILIIIYCIVCISTCTCTVKIHLKTLSHLIQKILLYILDGSCQERQKKEQTEEKNR